MDIISHGLYGGIAFGRKSRISYWKSFFFGVMPDLFSFGIFTGMTVLGLVSGLDWSAGPPNPNSVPEYVHRLYDITHSFIVAFGVFGLVWFLRKKPMYELLAWPLHIIVDIPTHSTAFFPTPFLWPLSDFRVDGVSWGHPYIFIPNVVFIVVLYSIFYIRKRKQNKSH